MDARTRLFIRDLTHLDCAWLDAGSGLLGESWSVDAELGGELDETGMICDFGIVKRELKRVLDEQVDHRLLLTAADHVELSEQGGSFELVHRCRDHQITRYRAPLQALCRLDAADAGPEALAEALARLLHPVLPDNVSSLRIRLRTVESAHGYRYCHGLRRHDGNCQRMAHGHRAQLAVAIDGTESPALAARWSARLDGRFIAHQADRRPGAAAGRQRYGYRAGQGEFELELPETRCYTIAEDATVECLSAHIAQQIAAEHGGHQVSVTCFEGIGKGAQSTRLD